MNRFSPDQGFKHEGTHVPIRHFGPDPIGRDGRGERLCRIEGGDDGFSVDSGGRDGDAAVPILLSQTPASWRRTRFKPVRRPANRLAAGIIFTMPAMILIGHWQSFDFWTVSLVALSGGLLGILFMIPMRRVFVVDNDDLPYPEGVACAAVLEAGEQVATHGSARRLA